MVFVRYTLQSLVLLLVATGSLSLLGCPPERENVPGASGGSFSEPAYFAWRQSNYGEAPQWGLLFVPFDENHSCEALLAYDWSDPDDYIQASISKARLLDWEGEFGNDSSGGCGDWYDPERRCFSGQHFFEGDWIAYGAASVLTMDHFADEEIRGSLTNDEGERLGFRAENCGELPYYYFVGDAEPLEARDSTSKSRPRTGDQAGSRDSGWGLRFR